MNEIYIVVVNGVEHKFTWLCQAASFARRNGVYRELQSRYPECYPSVNKPMPASLVRYLRFQGTKIN